MAAKRVMFVAGEASGDHHAAELIKALRQRAPGMKFFGFGGQAMRQAGLRLDLDLTGHAVIGFVEVLKHFGFFRRAFRQALKLILDESPDLLVLVDYPGFNLRLAKAARAAGYRGKMVGYISPQVWAWKKGRVKTMAKILDRMLVTFPFEKEIYDQVGLRCDFVGNPLIDSVKPGILPAAFKFKNQRVYGILPGSRAQEIRALLPVMLKTAERIAAVDPQAVFVVLQAPTVDAKLFVSALGAASVQLGKRLRFVLPKSQAQAMALRKRFDAAMVASGTATLETAMLKTPFIILYRLHPLTYAVGRLLIKIHSIGLANVVAGRRVVTEYLQYGLKPDLMARELLALARNEKGIASRQRRDLAKGLTSLGKAGVAKRAAACLLKDLA